MTDKGKRIIWIIGAGSGIGCALAIELSKQGHQLILSGRREGYLQNLKSESINDAMVLPVDITNIDQLNDAYTKIKNEFGFIDSIISMSADYQPMSVGHLDIQKCRNIIETNLMSAFLILDIVVPDMKTKGQGQIVFCGSVAGYRGLPNGQPYSASKAGLINLAESARLELYPFGIDVKIINPGFVKTEMTDKNSFLMPMMITADRAAKNIASQLSNSQQFEIRTHSMFSFIMKIIRIIPNYLYFSLLRKYK